MRKLCLILLLSGLFTGLYAQKLGYIRTDSAYISGDIYPQNKSRSAQTCLFRLYIDSKIETYTPDQILSYGYGKTDYYSYKIKSGEDSVQRFLLAIVQGDEPVYYLKDRKGKRFYILDSDKKLVELHKQRGEYKHQLAKQFGVNEAITKHMYFLYTRSGIKLAVKFLKNTEVEISQAESGKGKSNKPVTLRHKKAGRSNIAKTITFQTGITNQVLPFNQKFGLPAYWDKIKAQSLTYSLGVKLPVSHLWHIFYQQEVCFNKFVSNNKIGSNPPDYQLIQDYSVISLPAMLGYAMGKQKLTVLLTAGVQVDIALQKNNIGWLITGEAGNIQPGNELAIGYSTYNNIRPGFTAGLGLNYKINRFFAVTTDLRYTRINNLLPGNSGAESLYVLKAGISYYFGQKKK